jgi:hypothetical protein
LLLKPEKDSYRLPIKNLPAATPVDFIFLETKRAFDEIVGLKRQFGLLHPGD